MRRRFKAMALMLLCLFSLIWGGNGLVAFAESRPAEVSSLSGDVRLLKQEDDRYVMQVTVENSGEDFTGTVQVIFGASYDNCAYNTEITLPAQGKKQFTITVPERAADTVYGLCQLNFLDEKESVIRSISLKDVFNDVFSGIPVGILSDDYSGLTYMDAGGNPFYIRGMNSPMDLIELNNDNLSGYLNGLYFLIIDQFNVSVLSEDNIQAIQDWVKNGGWLIIGTGAYAEQTLSGFDEDFLNVEVTDVSEPGEENAATVNENRYGYYYNLVYEADIDLRQMAMADLDYTKMTGFGSVNESMETPAVNCSVEDGSVSILYFSLGEKELQKMSSYMVQNIYEELMYTSNSYRNFGGSWDMEYVGQRALAYIDSCNSDLDFSWLRILIILYVILVGPVLYLILRKSRKSEWYWVGAPVLGILFVAGVYLLGLGVRLNEAKAYSVTVQQTDDNRADTYMLAYHSGVKPWEVHLKDSYEVAGPGFQGYTYYGSSSSTISDYHYIVSNDSKGMSIGLKPRENFENGFFYAGKKAESTGALTGDELIGVGTGKLSGTVTNETDYDMAYVAVWSNSYIVVLSDVKAGETVDLQHAVADGKCAYQGSAPYFDSLLHDMVGIYGSRRDYAQDDMAALLIGLGVAEEKKTQSGTVILAGVVKDYDKAVADKCSETAYGCFYTYVRAGVGTGDDAGQADAGGEQNASY